MRARATAGRRLLRVAAIAAGAALLIVLLALAGSWLALRRPGVRRAVLDRLETTVAERTGVRLAIADFALALRGPTLTLTEVELVTGGEAPLLSLGRLEAAPRLRALRRDRLELKRLELTDLAVDLGQPLPAVPAGEAADEGTAFTLVIDRLALRDGRLDAPVLPESLRRWIAEWWIEGLRLDGRWGADDVELSLAGRPRWRRADGRPVDLSLAAKLAGPTGGPWEVPELSLAGAGLEARLEATVARQADQPLRAEFDLTLHPEELLPVPAADGPLRARGELDGRRLDGRLELAAAGVPSEWLEPWLGDLGTAAELLAETRWDLDADLRLDRRMFEAVEGRARLSGSRHGRRLIELDLQAPFAATDRSLTAGVELRLLPESAGRRLVTAGVAATGLDRLAQAELLDGRVDVEIVELGALLSELRALTPSLVPEPTALPLRGALRLAGSFAGPAVSPTAELEALWTPPAAGRVRLRAQGAPMERTADATATIEALELGALSPAVRGRLDGRGALSLRPETYRWSADLAASGLAATEGDASELDELRLVATGDPARLTLASLEGRLGERRFAGRGALELARPIAAGELALSLERPVPEVAGAELRLRLRQGALEAEVDSRLAAGGSGRLELAVPLATAAKLPPLAEALAGLPLRMAAGPIRLSWELPESDWAPTLGALTGDPAWRELRLAGRGSIVVDPLRPLAGSGRLELSGLAFERDEVRGAAAQPIRLRLEGGELIVEPVALESAGAAVELELWSELARDWQIGQPPLAAVRRFTLAAHGSVPAALVAGLLEGAEGEGTVQVDLTLSGTPADPRGELRLHGPGVVIRLAGERPWEVTAPRLEALLDQQSLRLTGAGLALDGTDLELAAAADWDGRQLRLRSSRVRYAGVEVAVTGDASVAMLRRLFGLEPRADEAAAGPLVVRWEVPETDWAPLLAELRVEKPPAALRGGLRGELNLDPAAPARSTGWLELSGLAATVEERQVTAPRPIRLRLADGRIELEPIDLDADGQPFRLEAKVALEPEWRAGDPPARIVRSLELDGQGTLVAALLNPLLAGGVAEGEVRMEIAARGGLEDLTGSLHLDGKGASVLFLSPYVARIEDFDLVFELAAGTATLRSGRLRLNEGEVELSGSIAASGLDLTAALDELRFRLDYGLLAVVDGGLRVTLDTEGEGRLAGELIVDQGTLTRPINIDRDLIAQLLLPVDLTGTEASPLENIALDLELITRRGVRVSNNVADLSVRWQPISVRGTLLQPVLDGRMDIEPGGRVFLFGQTVRIDRGLIVFPGEPGAEAVMELDTTSSLKDPSIARLAGDDPLAFPSDTGREIAQSEAIAEGVATFYGERIAARLGEALGGTEITFRPILIFGETDPGARLTVARDFSSYFTLAASLDLRNAERQTYLLDAHDLPGLRSITGQVFTNDEGTEGATLQQRLRFGGVRRTAATGPRIRKIRMERPAGVSKRGLRRSLGLEKGERISTEVLFVAEVEVGDYLQRRGYPDARVDLQAVPVPERADRVDLELGIRPGPRVRFEFEGESLPASLRRTITTLYRADFYEPVALDEMRVQTVRVLRSRGFLRPEVEIRVATSRDDSGGIDKTVVVRSTGGERLRLESLAVEGVADEAVERVRQTFATTVQRMELAAGEESADRRLLSTLRSLGYPRSQILERRLSEDGKVLTIAVDAGDRLRLAAVSVRGVEVDEGTRLAALAGLGRGEPARADRIAAGALAIEGDLVDRGFAEAQVRSRLADAAAAPEPAVELIYEVVPGPRFTVAGARVEGLRATRPRWASSVTGVVAGGVLQPEDIAAAERRLYETGLFSAVSSRRILQEDGTTEIVFQVEEVPRFSVAYGARWDSEDGVSAVVDAVDRNFLGRSLTLGMRALYASDNRRLRFSAAIPRLFGTRAVLELFASGWTRFDEETTEFFTTEFDEDLIESSLQIAYPFGQYLVGRIYGRYRTRRLFITETDLDPIFPLPPQVLEIESTTPLLGTQWIYDSRDRELVLTRGLFASADLSGTGEFLDSDFKYVRFFGQVNWYRPLGQWLSRRLSFAQSFRVGLADSFDQELIRDDRFFAGGEFSVRGYPTETLGPQERLGDIVVRPLGGSALLVLNEELRFELYDPVSGIVFFDLGNVWESTSDFGSDLFKSVGVGLRAVTPVGLLRLDWAFLLDRREDDPSSKIYFGFGTTF